MNLKKLDFYLIEDTSTRLRVTMFGVAAGLFTTAFAEVVLGQAHRIGFIVAFLTVGFVEIIGATTYSLPDLKMRRVIQTAPLRRGWLLPVVSGILLLCVFIPIPLTPAEAFAKELEAAAERPSTKTIDKLDAGIALVTKKNVKINPAILASAGTRLVDVARENPAAWDTVQKLLSYRSGYPNEDRIIHEVTTVPGAEITFDRNYEIPGKPAPQLSVSSPNVLPQESGTYEMLGSNLIMNSYFGFPELVFKNGALGIDRHLVKHMLFQNMEIHYDGGPLELEDVVFDGCTFVMKNTDATRRLAKAILMASPVDFKDHS